MATDPLVTGTPEQKLAEIRRVLAAAKAELARQEDQRRVDARINDYLTKLGLQLSGQALRMRLELARLAERHGVLPARRAAEPLLPEADDPCTLSGICSAPIVDLERVKLRNFSLGWLPWQLPPLRWRHEPSIVGTVDRLAWTDAGLAIMCTTDHPLAIRAPAFSIAAKVNAYEIVNADRADFHAVVTSAWLEEISLTDRPACPEAMVLERVPASPVVHGFYPLMQQRADCLIRLTELLRAQ